MTGAGITEGGPLLRVEALSVSYPQGRRRPARAVLDAVSLDIGPGETVGLVGESGSGKSTLANAILGTARPTSGTIHFGAEDITRASAERRRALTAEIQVVFQDPFGSLNPARTVGQTLEEPLLAHAACAPDQRRGRVEQALERVGLPAAAADQRPGSFSGGQRQRIAIARALMLSPRLLICDEAVSALDLSVQAQILNVLASLRDEFGMAILFITHDMAVVRRVAGRVVVLYEGRVMESGSAEQICEQPMHPYTRRLVASAPVPDPAEQSRRRLDRAPVATLPPRDAGCPFRPRCAFAIERCAEPVVTQHDGGRAIACVRHPLDGSRPR